ncbi:hypothetical protein M2401_005517 [Pseudomonas sp. JUb42]|nr:hypothetical protein [Pseudomonas sp. JUb42]
MPLLEPEQIEESDIKRYVDESRVFEIIARASVVGAWELVVRSTLGDQVLARQRGGVRQFSSLDAIANIVRNAGLTRFSVDVQG